MWVATFRKSLIKESSQTFDCNSDIPGMLSTFKPAFECQRAEEGLNGKTDVTYGCRSARGALSRSVSNTKYPTVSNMSVPRQSHVFLRFGGAHSVDDPLAR